MATGKISRLPREIREQVNERLDAGEPGNRLVAWLNELPEVRALMAAEFGGAAIKEQNLTNWKQGGFREWRREQEVAALGQTLAGEKPVTVTTEDLLTLATTRYLVLARDCNRNQDENPNRQWRRWRVMCHDVMKLRRSEHQAGRLELDWERLQFTQERFEDEKLTGDRRAMVAFLMAARQWPEVQEALAGAFRLFQERKGAEIKQKETELGPIKVNQGGMNKKNEEAQTKLVDCSPSPVSSPPGRGDDLAQVWVQESITTSAAVGARMEVNMAELGSIKVNQGEIKLKNEEMPAKVVGCLPSPAGRMGSFPPVAVTNEPVLVHHDGAHGVTRPTYAMVGKNSHTTATAANVNWSQLGPIKVDQGEIFYLGRERMGASNGRGEFAWRCAGDKLPDEDWPSRVRKRCRLPQWRNLPPQSMTIGGKAISLVRICGIAACQRHKVPATQANTVAARRCPPSPCARQLHPFWNFESDFISITLPALI